MAKDINTDMLWLAGGGKEVKFQVDTRLVTEILSRGQYSHIKSIISEYVANAWDADATEVQITIPDDFTSDPIIIEDNGEGIDLDLFSVVAMNKQVKNRKRTPSNRTVIGSKGIGRWSGFAFADKIYFETRKDGNCYKFALDKKDLANHESLTEYECSVTEEECELPPGTKVTLISTQKMVNPSPKTIRDELLLEFGFSPDFIVYVNKQRLAEEDLPGEKYVIDEKVPEVGRITGYINVLDFATRKTNPGIIVRVSGRRVVGPDFFGTEDDYPKKILARIRGEVNADGLADIITSNREAFIEYDEKYLFLKGWIQDKLSKIASSIQDEENFDVTKEILSLPTVKERYNQLPPYFQKEYFKQLQKFAPKLGRLRKDKDLLTLFGLLLLRAMESVDFQSILSKLQETDSRDIASLAKVLRDWGFGEITRASNLIQERLTVLQRFSDFVENDKTLELAHIHSVLESNTWILDERYDLFISNQSLKTTIEKLGGQIVGKQRKKRPDLILKRGRRDFLLIELKRPKEVIDLSHAAQVLQYRAAILKEFPEMRDLDIYLVGREFDESVRINYPEGNVQRLRLLSLKEIVQAAYDRLRWLSDELKNQYEYTPELSQVLSEQLESI